MQQSSTYRFQHQTSNSIRTPDSEYSEESNEQTSIKEIIQKVMKKREKKVVDRSKEEKIMDINMQIEIQNEKLRKKIKNMDKKLSKARDKAYLEEQIKEKKKQLECLKKRLGKAEQLNSKMESQFLFLSQSRKKSRSKTKSSKIKIEDSKAEKIDYYSPIMHFESYSVEPTLKKQAAAQASLDHEQYLEQNHILDARKRQLQMLVKQKNKKIQQYQQKVTKYLRIS